MKCITAESTPNNHAGPTTTSDLRQSMLDHHLDATVQQTVLHGFPDMLRFHFLAPRNIRDRP
jgi:hypothetical protein